MDREAIRKTLHELLEEEMCETYDNLDDSSNIREDLQLDSVDVIGLVLRIENHFQISIDTEELENIVAVSDLLDLVEEKVSRGVGDQAA